MTCSAGRVNDYFVVKFAMPIHPYNEAGRRIKAALISRMMGMAGVDSTLKKLPEVVDESWAILAQELTIGMQNARQRPLGEEDDAKD